VSSPPTPSRRVVPIHDPRSTPPGTEGRDKTGARRHTARGVAAVARAGIAFAGVAVALGNPGLHPHAGLAAIGMAVIGLCAISQLLIRNEHGDRVEETMAAVGGVLVNGFGDERVTAITLLWLAAVITGALARGRVYLLAAAIFAVAMGLPIVRSGSISLSYLGLCVAATALLVAGRAMLDELGSALELARYEADHDGLTGALARSAFRAALEQAVAAADERHPVALVMLDLDRFGLVNKLYGHAAGDHLLTRAVAHMRELGGEGAIVGRLGGDEFAVTVAADAEPLARELLARLSRDGGDAPGAAGSIGIAWAPHDGLDASALLRAGDVALRVAKQSPQNRVSTYTGESFSGDHGAQTVLARLIGGEGLEMVTQPIFDLHDGRAHAYEALARFQLGSRRSPLYWFSVAEEFGQRDALEQACLSAAIRLLPDLPAGARLSVNLSGATLPDARTLAILDAPGDLSRLIVEITEDTLVRNDDPSLNAAIALLRRRGAQLAVDDMGAGYAGLRQITAVRPDYLKLDRTLISGIDADADRAALVKAMVDYADRVGALLVAEGIETEAELATMRDLGVHLLQGFLLARPAAGWPLAGGRPAALAGAGADERRAA
jgi:diguanylate cyclase (GGDEF)-like protein